MRISIEECTAPAVLYLDDFEGLLPESNCRIGRIVFPLDPVKYNYAYSKDEFTEKEALDNLFNQYLKEVYGDEDD